MNIEAHFIPGVMLGFEYVEAEAANFIVVDLIIVRLLFIFGEV